MLEAVIFLAVKLLGIALIAGMFIWLCDYIAREYPQSAPLTKVVKVLVVVVSVLVAIVLIARFLGV